MTTENADPMKTGPDVDYVAVTRRTETFIGEAFEDPRSPSAVRDRMRRRDPCPVCGHPTGDCH